MSDVADAARTDHRWRRASRAALLGSLAFACAPGEAPLAAPGTSEAQPSPGSDVGRSAPDAPVSPAPIDSDGERPAALDAELEPLAPSAAANLGPDAGTSDAGTSDAGAGDAGADDTATSDAAASDAGPPPSNDCCSPSASGGCSEPAVAACVCEGDPFCCSTEYDETCVTQAVSRCAQDCDARAPTSDCCAPSDIPGCTRPDILACICAIDPACCVLRFDQSCVNLGTSSCGAACPASGEAP